MKIEKGRRGTGFLAGLFLTASITGLMLFAYQWVKLPFVPFNFFDWMTRVLPGRIVTFGIDLMISIFRFLGINVASTAKGAEQFIAIVQFIAGGMILGGICFGIYNRIKTRLDNLTGIITGVVAAIPFLTISLAIGQSPVKPLLQALWLMILFLFWGIFLSKIYNRLTWSDTDKQPTSEKDLSVLKTDRRKFLFRIGGYAAFVTLSGTFAGTMLARTKRSRSEEELDKTMAHRTETGNGIPFPNLDDPVVPAPGTRPEYTPLKDHYKVFIRTEPTIIDGSTWKLPITGMVDNPLILTLDDIKTRYKSRSYFVTISCISGRIGTHLIGTTMWTGVSMQDILSKAKVKKGAAYLYITSGDGYYETVDLRSIAGDERIMLCYAWDGHDLPVDHGYPLRIWIPDRYGMKQPKWITGIEVTDIDRKGYWVERGWDPIARVKTISFIDTVAVNAVYENGDQQLIPTGGIAFSGTRGISKVEVSVDNGPWTEAELRSPLSDATWVIWRYDWPLEKGEHVFRVRCYEGDGTPQILVEHPAHPSGATGIDTYAVTV